MIEVERVYESQDQMVSHPNHYQGLGGIEVIDVIETFTEHLKGIKATDTGNAIKYILRWPMKNGAQDLEKAKWYLSHLYLRTKPNFIEAAFSTNRLTPIPEYYNKSVAAIIIAFSVSPDDERAITAILSWSVTQNRNYIQLAIKYIDKLIEKEK